MASCRRRRVVLLVAVLGCILAGRARAQTVPCPTAPDPTALPDAATLRKMNAFVDRLGSRPTGSKTHHRYVDWIRRRLRKIDGVTLQELDYPIERWTPGKTKLTMIVGD